jgi:uncharacterized protein (UPF0332 family)
MTARDILDVADALITGSKEAEWRSAVSRAYYAAFHVARQLLLQCGFVVPQGDQAHAYLWLRLANSGHPDVQIAGNDLNFLRKMRNWADYDLDRPMHPAPASGQVRATYTIIELLETVATEPVVRTQVTEAVKNYERDVLREVTWRP